LLNLIAMATILSPGASAPWKPCSITTYGPGYHGRRTASGERFDDNKMTVAMPMRGRRPVVPFGKTIEVKWKGRTVQVKVNDVCPGGTVDLSKAAMKKLLGRYANTKLRGGSYRVL